MNINNKRIIHGALFLVVLLLSSCSDGSGSLATAAKAWGTAALIELNAGDAYAPQIAFDTNGNALAVWEQYDGVNQSIYTNRYSASSGVWGTATLIELNAGDAKRPQIAFDASGNALAVWYQYDGAFKSIWANRYTAGTGTWGTAAVIETGNVGDAQDPKIAIDINGNALAVWSQSDGTRNNIWANRYNAGTGLWGTAELIETVNTGGATGPQIAIDPSGNAMAVWFQYDGSINNIWANRYTFGSGWGIAKLIETDITNSAESPQIAVDANGNALAVWQQTDGTRYNIMANRYTASTNTWGGAALIEIDNFGPAYQPQIAIDSNGNAFAVWQQNTVTGVNIWANRYTAGAGTWGTATFVENNSVGSSSHPKIAFDTNGNALAVWDQNDGFRTNIWSNRYTAGTGTWSTAQLIETDNAGAAETPQIAIDASGNALAVWDQDDGTRFNIWANRFQ